MPSMAGWLGWPRWLCWLAAWSGRQGGHAGSHRLLGWAGVTAVVLGFLTAGLVLAGMYARAGYL